MSRVDVFWPGQTAGMLWTKRTRRAVHECADDVEPLAAKIVRETGGRVVDSFTDPLTGAQFLAGDDAMIVVVRDDR